MPDPNDAARRAANRALVERFMGAIGRRDWSTLRAICDPDFLFEAPYGDPPFRVEGLEAYLGYVEQPLEIFRFELVLDRLHEALDPDHAIAEYRSDGIATPTGKPYLNRYVGFFSLGEGRIRGLREYWNPAVATESLAAD
ncbi:MAG: nuclear transport factor 2 family protein [Spirochaetaceae bacterium]|nr:nuclear transport factor 2 family protein [Myxococcales bacterium]MCB9724759.1 nuclear transport factor 2 family protein [Spirochaetaceae bacterium]HPG24766.1 nuclear transport factor 2 family protein [Myxococcota bacterium]